jgi:glycosyltransferase involved in cell wall biosynthesis
VTILFSACVGFVVYTYFGYPLLLWLLASLAGRPVRRAPITPTVSLIITARNEAKRMREKIENTLMLDYPRDLLEIIVASDCSDDGTDDIVRAYAHCGVRLVAAPERRGKEFAQSLAMAAAAGEILVFTDAATALEPEGVRNIVQNFADPTIGCVSSADRVVGAGGQAGGEGAYIRYDTFLRSLESRIGSVNGLTGAFFAARREVCDPWPVDLPSDFNTLLSTVGKRLRGICDQTAVATYADLSDVRAEYRRKVRTATRGLRSLGRRPQLLNPFRYGLSAWVLLSHKLCRYLVPFALLGAFASSFTLARESALYTALAAAQLVGYAFAAVVIGTGARVTGLWRIVPFFVLVNLSALHAWVNALRGRGAVTWEPSER